MAGRGITVRDFRTEVPGKLSDNRTSYEFPTIIATKRNSEQTIEWRLIVRMIKATVDDNGDIVKRNFIKINDKFFDSKKLQDGVFGWIKVFKKHSGSPTWDKTTPTIVRSGKNIGKKNETNTLTQALRDAYGLYNKQLERAAETRKGEDWEAERFPPMLVQSLGDKEINYQGAFIQRKLDGVRTVATIEKDGAGADSHDIVVLYSRNKKLYEGKSYLREKLLPILQHYRDDRNMIIYLDGEVYAHGESLQTISGEMRQTAAKENPNIRLTFCIFDVFVPAQPKLTYTERKAILDELFATQETAPELEQVETFPINTKAEADALYQQFLDDEYEGAILRLADKPYEYSHKGYHSAFMLKMKPTFDDEFELVGYSGKKGKGKAEGLLMLQLKTADGTIFDVTPMGEHKDRKRLFDEFSKVADNGKTVFENDWKGRMMTVVFDDLSDDNVPLRGRAKAIRDYE